MCHDVVLVFTNKTIYKMCIMYVFILMYLHVIQSTIYAYSKTPNKPGDKSLDYCSALQLITHEGNYGQLGSCCKSLREMGSRILLTPVSLS